MTASVRYGVFFAQAVAAHSTCVADDFSYFHANVIGTSLKLRVSAESQATADRAKLVALQEIERLGSIFSHYDSGTEFAKFRDLPIGSTASLSPELFECLCRFDDWSKLSNGAFNAGAEELIGLSQDAENTNLVPDSKRLTASVKKATSAHGSLNSEQQTATRRSDAAVSLKALAKRIILDAVCDEVLSNLKNVTG